MNDTLSRSRRVAMKELAVGKAMAVPFEPIIAADGSPDRSGQIADALARIHPEIKVVQHDKNLGYGVTSGRC